MQKISRVWDRQAGILDYFSIGLLVSTLFAPFRQISAGSVSGPVGVKWHAFVDRLVSRCIGGIVRSIMVVIGSSAVIGSALLGIVELALWIVTPLLLIIGVILLLIGWVPSWK